MKRKVFASLMSFVLIISLLFSLSVSANAASGVEKGTMRDTSSANGGYINWVYSYNTTTGKATLSITGNGYMPNGTDQDWFQVQRERGCYIYEVTVGEGVKSIMQNAFADEKYLNSVSLPSTLEFIGENAFAYTPELKQFHIPKKLGEINANIFTGSAIKEFTVDSNNPYYKSSGGNLYSKDMTTLVVAAPGKFADADYKFTIPKKVTTISPFAFYCTDIESIKIPANVTEIGRMAFAGCLNLSKVTIENGVKRLYDSVFLACSSLKELHLPASVDYIGYCTIGYIYVVDLDALREQLDRAGLSYAGLNEANYEIYAAKLGYSGDVFISCYADPSFKIYAPKGSAGENYASNNGIGYIKSSNLISAVNKTNGVQLKWSYSDQVLLCRLYKKDLEGKWQVLTTFDGSVTSYLDKSAYKNSDNVYSLQVYYYTDGENWDTGGITCHYVTAPVLTSTQNKVNGVRIDWKSQSGMKYYYIYRKAQNETSWSYIARVSGTKTYYVDENVKGNNTYTYKVRANDGTAGSAYSSPALTTTFVKNPTFKVYNTEKGVAVRWTKEYETDSYRVYRKTSTSGWKLLATVDGSKSAYQDLTAKRGATYSYTVRAVYNGVYSGYHSAGETIKSIAAPMNLKIQNKASGVSVSWNKCAGANGYYVYKKNSAGKWVKIATLKGNSTVSYLDKDTKSGYIYNYRVRAYGGDSVSTYDSAGIKIRFLSTPKISSAVSTKSGVYLKYNAISGSKGYYVYRKTQNSSWTRIGTVNNQKTTSYTDKTAKKGQTYIYTVRAYNGTTLSSYYSSGIKIKDIY